MNRRSLLKHLGLTGLSSVLLGKAAVAEAILSPVADITNSAKRVLRFAHLTDVHMQPEKEAPKGLAACLHHLQNQQDRPSLLINTGDCIMDALRQDRDRVETQWQLWHQLMKNENSLPIQYCIGNHDCWGAGEKSDPLYGKKYALDMMHLEKPYRSFDMVGWHFVVLDSIQTKSSDGSWYTCQLDEAQYEWLTADLELNKNKHTVILSHAPIVSAAIVVVDHKGQNDVGYRLNQTAMHTDAERIIALFDSNPQVKLALSGHIHLYEEVKYHGVTYISNGAVSGNWWKGSRWGTDNGYALVDLYEDGTFGNQYVPYGWKIA